jgi:tetratricopeptide (TPR) repeat protein
MAMQNLLFLILAFIPGLVHPVIKQANTDDLDITGQWVRIGPMGPVALTFKADGVVEGDFGNDNTIEIVAEYRIDGDHILFKDKEGVTCPETGKYEIYSSDHYIAFDLVEDNCAGRLRSTLGFWVRPGFNDLLSILSDKIHRSADPEDYLNRARMYMAIGKSAQAKMDFDKYIKHDQSDARVYVNRAGARMPDDLQGVVDDCNRAIALEPDNKNAYFLRGLASYGLGKKEEACADFYRAIELGFSVLKEAEYEKCAEYWESIQ